MKKIVLCKCGCGQPVRTTGSIFYSKEHANIYNGKLLKGKKKKRLKKPTKQDVYDSQPINYGKWCKNYDMFEVKCAMCIENNEFRKKRCYIKK